MIIGHEVASINPYAMKQIHPRELIILNFLTSFMEKDIIKSADAAYPTNSV